MMKRFEDMFKMMLERNVCAIFLKWFLKNNLIAPPPGKQFER